MPQLHKDFATGVVDGVNDRFPAGNHFLGVNSRRVHPTVGLRGDRGGLRNDQSSTCSLTIVSRHQFVWHTITTRSPAGQRSHCDSVGQFKIV